MRNKTALLISLIVILLSCRYNDNVKVQINSPTLPVLTGKENNPVQQITLVRDNGTNYNIRKVVFSLQGTTDSENIAKISIFKTDEAGKFDTAEIIAETVPKGNMATFTHHFPLTEDTLTLWVSVTLKENIDLTHRVRIRCETIITNKGKLYLPKSETKPLRTGVALRQHGQDGVHTSRIPELATSKQGTVLAIYDARYESARDLQGHIDIAMNRSLDGGCTWEPMQVILDRNEWGGMPEKYNGVSDACILVDEKSGDDLHRELGWVDVGVTHHELL